MAASRCSAITFPPLFQGKVEITFFLSSAIKTGKGRKSAKWRTRGMNLIPEYFTVRIIWHFVVRKRDEGEKNVQQKLQKGFEDKSSQLLFNFKRKRFLAALASYVQRQTGYCNYFVIITVYVFLRNG